MFRVSPPHHQELTTALGASGFTVGEKRLELHFLVACQTTTARDKIHEKNSRIHLERLQNKYTNCKGIKNNTSFEQITGIQEKVDTTCK